ncbi:MAG: ammonium transporter [Terriglobia bacterium]
MTLPLSGTAPFFCAVSILLVPFAIIGVCLVNTGLTRSRSAAHSIMASLCAIAIAVVAYFVCGFSWQGIAGVSAHSLAAPGRHWNWIAAEPLFLRGLRLDGSAASLIVLLGLFSVALVAVIPLGSGGDRWRIGAICASTVLLAGWTYPLFAHWAWGGGWLERLGAAHGLGHGFVDCGGAGTIQVVGGLTALSIAWVLGPRRGKYGPGGMMVALPGHNAVYVLFGSMLAWVGWLGLNFAGSVLFAGLRPERFSLIAINTTLAASVALLTVVVLTRLRFGKPDASLSANGWVGGLVAGSAACGLISPAAAALVGLVAGILVTFGVEWCESKLQVDDPGGAISVHALCGIWGLLAVGLFARFPAGMPGAAGEVLPGRIPGQWIAQLVGIATLIGFVLPLTYGLNWLLNLLLPQRVASEGERQGLDLHELGAGAYPEFLTHDEQW